MNGYFVLFLIFPPKGMVHLLFGFSFLVLGMWMVSVSQFLPDLEAKTPPH
jgi:hypothetical protein